MHAARGSDISAAYPAGIAEYTRHECASNDPIMLFQLVHVLSVLVTRTFSTISS